MIPALGSVIYDGNCGFCRRTVGWVRRRAGTRFNYVPNESSSPEYISAGKKTVLLLDGHGRLYKGAAAVFRMLEIIGAPFLWNLYQSQGWFTLLSDAGYGFISFSRPVLSIVLDLFLGPPPEDL
jgi:predicted DCC family thiol-disulfide oxidoreductase YuxK